MKTQSIIFIVLIVVIFYALFILPNRRQQKNRQTMMSKLGPGAKVLTSGGIYGEIVSIEGDVLVVRIAEDVEIELDQRAIIRVVEEAPLDVEDEDESDEDYADEESDKFSTDFNSEADEDTDTEHDSDESSSPMRRRF